MGRGKGVKAQYNKFSNLRSCIEAGGQASKNSCIKEVIEDQLQTELGYEVGGIRLLLIFLRGRRDVKKLKTSIRQKKTLKRTEKNASLEVPSPFSNQRPREMKTTCQI